MKHIKFERFIGTDIDIDTYNDVTDYGIAFVGPIKLTEDGQKEFGCLMDLDVAINATTDCAIVEMPPPTGANVSRLSANSSNMPLATARIPSIGGCLRNWRAMKSLVKI